MSLYYEAARIIDGQQYSAKPLKDIVYKNKDLKSAPGAVFALVSQSALWSDVLSGVIESAGLLQHERKLTPTLALLLTHDLLVAKKGLATNKLHPLHVAISKHRARLSAELTKARIKKGAASLDALDGQLQASQAATGTGTVDEDVRPRWFRVNTIKTTLEDCLTKHFADLGRVQHVQALRSKKDIHIDEHVPCLLAVHPSLDLTKTTAYRDGHIILQDKASCFPAYLLDPPQNGRAIDGCAAPGNKTTHLAAILHGKASDDIGSVRVVACERAKDRAETLTAMVRKAGASPLVQVRAGQDFLKLDPLASEWEDVTSILLDPSCSGSGIVGRDDGEGDDESFTPLRFVLPRTADQIATKDNRKRKRKDDDDGRGARQQPAPISRPQDAAASAPPDDSNAEVDKAAKLAERLRALSGFQLKLLTHAFRFTNARRITYSTCSVHGEENEMVVIKALCSDTAASRGWRPLRRNEQVDGLRRWHRRGDVDVCRGQLAQLQGGGSGVEEAAAEEMAQACIRCAKGTDEGTMGFFVAGFVREPAAEMVDGRTSRDTLVEEVEDEEADEWAGFED